MQVAKSDYRYRVENHRARYGPKGVVTWLRRVPAVERDKIKLDGVSRAEIVAGKAIEWQHVGGLLGMGAWLTYDRLRNSRYMTRQPKGAQL